MTKAFELHVIQAVLHAFLCPWPEERGIGTAQHPGQPCQRHPTGEPPMQLWPPRKPALGAYRRCAAQAQKAGCHRHCIRWHYAATQDGRGVPRIAHGLSGKWGRNMSKHQAAACPPGPQATTGSDGGSLMPEPVEDGQAPPQAIGPGSGVAIADLVEDIRGHSAFS